MRSRSPSFLTLVPVLLLAGSGMAVQAQVTTGSLTMVISDRSTGRLLPGARVELSSPALFQKRILEADAHGQIRALLLPVGNYTATVSQPGFRNAQVLDMRIGLGANMAQNVDLASLSGDTGSVIVTTIAASSDMDGGTDIADSGPEESSN
jgi:hypothetical protein